MLGEEALYRAWMNRKFLEGLGFEIRMNIPLERGVDKETDYHGEQYRNLY